MSAGVHQLDGIVLAISFFPRMEGEKNEIYPLAIVGRASNVGDRVGSGSGSRSRPGARIYRGRVLHEGFKSKSLLEYQLSLAGENFHQGWRT
jgi:ribosomal protein L16/L10AE